MTSDRLDIVDGCMRPAINKLNNQIQIQFSKVIAYR